MFKRFHTWMRAVLPADSIVLTVVGAVTLIVVYGYVASGLGVISARESANRTLALVAIGVTILYAGFRAGYFSPLENRPYGVWLANTGWQFPDPLPLGPMQLVWQDAIVIALLMAIFAHERASVPIIPTLFLVTYSISIITPLRLGITWPAYCWAFLMGFFLLAIFNPVARLLIALAMYVCAYGGLRQVLRTVPLENAIQQPPILRPPGDDSMTTAGWPVPPISKCQWASGVPQRDAVLCAVLVGWLMFCSQFPFRLSYGIDLELDSLLFSLHSVITAAAILLRLWFYLAGYVPPISLPGRIATGRLIVPGYDFVFLAPLATLAAAWLLPIALQQLGMPSQLAVPIASSLTVWLALALPPTLEEWEFQGSHRIAFRFRAKWPSGSDRRAPESINRSGFRIT